MDASYVGENGQPRTTYDSDGLLQAYPPFVRIDHIPPETHASQPGPCVVIAALRQRPGLMALDV